MQHASFRPEKPIPCSLAYGLRPNKVHNIQQIHLISPTYGAATGSKKSRDFRSETVDIASLHGLPLVPHPKEKANLHYLCFLCQSQCTCAVAPILRNSASRSAFFGALEGYVTFVCGYKCFCG